MSDVVPPFVVRKERFILARVADGGLLLDHDTGALLRLNESAAFVWKHVLDGIDADEVVPALASTFGIEMDLARNDLNAALNLAAIPASTLSPPDLAFRLRPSGTIYQFLVHNVPVFEMSPSGEAVRICVDATTRGLHPWLRAMSPKLLALQGITVLHASAVRQADESLLVFLGDSGAGKTTTARAFAKTGLDVVCEDKLVLRQHHDQVCGFLEAESVLESRLEELYLNLIAVSRNQWCDATVLAKSVTKGPALRLRDILILDPRRRRGQSIAVKRLGEIDAVTAIFTSMFLASPLKSEWLRQLDTSVALSLSASIHIATVPDGEENLVAAAWFYRESNTS